MTKILFRELQWESFENGKGYIIWLVYLFEKVDMIMFKKLTGLKPSKTYMFLIAEIIIFAIWKVCISNMKYFPSIIKFC